MRLKEAFFPSVEISPEERRLIKMNTVPRFTVSRSSIGNYKETKTEIIVVKEEQFLS